MQDLVDGETLSEAVSFLKSVSTNISALKKGCAKMESEVEKAEGIEELPEKAKFFSDSIVPLLEEVRIPADELERIVPDDMWPLPKYSEMLFIM